MTARRSRDEPHQRAWEQPYLGLGGRLSEGPGPELVDFAFSLECADAPILHRGLGLADIAQAVVLKEGGFVDAEDGRLLLNTLLDLWAIPANDFPYEPALGDAWNSRHRELARRVGGLAGWLTIGRPRREAGRVAFRVALRERVLTAHASLTSLASALLTQSRAHRNTVMADYTYLQPAQPTTLGYLLLSYLFPVLRDAERLRRSYRWINMSPAGAGGNAGSSLPLDRRRLASLLGFDGPILHARDAMWQVDGLVELMALVAGASGHAAQIAADLEVFAASAFAFVELADAYSRASALMPQKKNPYPVAIVRGAAGVLAGRLTGLLSVLRTGSARTDHFVFAYGEVPRALDLFAGSEQLLAATIRTAKFNRPALEKSAHQGFLGAADLAEGLATTGMLDHESAHSLVGAAVRAATKQGRTEVTMEDLREQAAHMHLRLNADDKGLKGVLERSLDPVELVQSRVVVGGSTKSEVSAMLRATSRRLRDESIWSSGVRASLHTAEESLLRLAERAAKR